MLLFDIEITPLCGILLDLTSFNRDRNGPSSDPVGAMCMCVCVYIYIHIYTYIYILSHSKGYVQKTGETKDLNH